MDYKGGIILIPNMKFYVISIVSIFAALGIGIYIGFTLDTQSFVEEQKSDIAFQLEEKFDFFKSENQELKTLLKDMQVDNDRYEYFVDAIFEDLVEGKLVGSKVALIETKNDYMYSGIGQILEVAGADVVYVATITDKLLTDGVLNEIYIDLGIDLPQNDLIVNSIEELVESIVNGEENEILNKLIENDLIDMVGVINQPVDHIILAGGSIKADSERIDLVDKTIVSMVKEMDKEIIGIEKLNTNISYIEDYKNLKISTVDNVDTPMGKVALILAMEGRPGNYGIKKTAEELIPDLNLPIVRDSEE